MKQAMAGFAEEFMSFLKEHKVVGLAVAFIMGSATTVLVKSLVDDVIMPIITPFIPGGGWETATLTVGPVVMKIGSFLGNLLNFVILALVVFALVKLILREDKAGKK